MNNHFVRRLGVLTVGAVALGSLSLVASGSAGAVATGADPAPATASAAWIASQLKNGIVSFGGDEFANYGATMDAALGMQAAAVAAPTQAVILAAITSNVVDATSGFGDVYAGSTAKVAYYAQQNGEDAKAFGGVDLIAQLEPQIVDGGPSAGRLFEGPTAGDPDTDYGNVLSQSFAAAALRAGGSTKAAAASTFLLAQQCAAGFFTQDFAAAPDAADQTCDGNAASQSSVDATGQAVLTLAGATDAASKAAVVKAVAWLASVQAANGSFDPSGAKTGGNASSTGLAGAALGTTGQNAAAAKAALWLRGQQLANAATCAPYAAADSGAVAQDAAALAAVPAKPIATAGNAVVDQFRVATAQTLGALAFTPGGGAAGDTTLTAPANYTKAGATAVVAVAGAPGNTLCLTAGTKATRLVLDATGAAVFPITLATEGDTTITATDAGGETDTTTVSALAKKKLKATVKDRTLKRGQKAVVKVRGLAPGEQVTVKLRGKKVTTTVNDQGRKNVKVKAKGKPGKAKLVIKGEFGNRKGKTTVRIVR